jgi:hypothetical protein
MEDMVEGSHFARKVLYSHLDFMVWLWGRARARALFDEVAQRTLRRLQEQAQQDPPPPVRGALPPRPVNVDAQGGHRGGRHFRKQHQPRGGGGGRGGAGQPARSSRPY